MRAALLVGLLVLCPSAYADIFTAQLAYEKGDYERAFKDYRDLAELGQPLAQFNLAVMYARGLGTRQSDLYAYAWATLAAENGSAPGKSLADKLRPRLAPGSEQIADDIARPYSRAALDAQLMPHDPVTAMDRRCLAMEQYSPEYPAQGRRQGVQGEVYVEYTVMADGSARNPRIIYEAVSGGFFDDAVKRGVMRSRYRPLEPGAPAIHCERLWRFTLDNTGSAEYPQLLNYLEQTRKKAENGDTGAQWIYGMLLGGLPQLGHRPQDGMPWFLKAAQAGSREAQYEVGTGLLTGWGCQCDEKKGLIWLRKAAEADEPDAQVTLATYDLRGTPDAAGTRRAVRWLERAAGHGNPYAREYLSAVLAASAVTETREPKRALELIRSAHPFEEDPTPLEIEAAAEAGAGDFKAAIKAEQRAIRMATDLHWDAAPLTERLDSYQHQKPWYGDLLGF